MSEYEARKPIKQMALVQSQGTTFFAKATEATLSPQTAVVQLVQGLYDLEPKFARRILRNRIYANYPVSVMCRGMVRVAAKRITVLTEDVFAQRFNAHLEAPCIQVEGANTALKSRALSADQLTRLNSSKARANDREGILAELMKIARTLVDQPTIGQPRYLTDRAVACLLATNQGEIMAAAVNNNGINKTFHAEVNLIQDYFNKTHSPLPFENAVFITTLKPCVMCASMIWHCAADRQKINVLYGEDDSGCHSRRTILDEHRAQRRLTFDQG